MVGGSTPDASCPGARKVVTEGRHLSDCTARKKPTQEFVPFGEKVLARQITTDPMNRMNPRYQYGVRLGMRNNSAEGLIANADGVFRAREIWRLEHQDRWDTDAINSVIGVPWRMTDRRWTVDRPEVRVDPIPIPPLPFGGTNPEGENHQARHRRVRSHDWMPRLQCDQGQKKSTSTLRSQQKANRRASQNHSAWSREIWTEEVK